MTRRPARLLVWSGRACALGLATLLAVHTGVGDASPLLFAVGSLLLYAFLPLPALLGVALWLRDRSLAIAFGLGAAAAAWLWGGLFLPRAAAAPSAKATLTVLSYNALGYNFDTDDTVQIVRESRADVVAIQELNLQAAAALVQELGSVYPYRWLEPRADLAGGGLLSRHPFQPSPRSVGGSWTSPAMAVELDVAGRRIGVVGFHAFSGPEHVERRAEQARALAAYARQHHGPLVMLGDLNATDRNDAYASVATELRDAWREAGWGFGHTFPGPPTSSEGGSRPTILGVPVPLWLVRIDYVFHSAELQALSASTTLSRGRSDHRGVVATFALP